MTFELIPAIDLKGGRCVRLRQGRMEDETVFSDDPVAMASQWVEQGCNRLHLVDLDGAFAGEPRHAEVIRKIVDATGVEVEVGGGIRSAETIRAYIDAGVRYAIIGTKAVQDPDFVDQVCLRYPNTIIVGLDAKDGMVATDGWAETATVTAVELGKRFAKSGVNALLYTDIARDGMMTGVNVEATAELARESGLPVIASGGVASMDDLDALYEKRGDGICGSILGRSIYEGTIDLPTALRKFS